MNDLYIVPCRLHRGQYTIPLKNFRFFENFLEELYTLVLMSTRIQLRWLFIKIILVKWKKPLKTVTLKKITVE